LIADQAPISTCETVQNSSGCVKTEWLKTRPTAQLHKVRTASGSDRVVSERLDYAGHYKKPALLEKRNYGCVLPAIIVSRRISSLSFASVVHDFCMPDQPDSYGTVADCLYAMLNQAEH